MNRFIVGIDIAKYVFQLYQVDMTTGEVKNIKLHRDKFLLHFANHVPCRIGMEACGGAQHWARELIKIGHDVVLIAAQKVRPFVIGNKNDAADARAIWQAMQQPGMQFVTIKSEEDQAILALHRVRQQLVTMRTMQINALRGLLTEYGEVMAAKRANLRKGIDDVLARMEHRLPGIAVDTLREQWSRIIAIDGEVHKIEARLKAWFSENEACKTIAEIPGIGLISATAVIATMSDPAAFKNGREFAAWLGLVPRQRGTGGRVQLLGISKRGDVYVRTMLVHAARSAYLRAHRQEGWLGDLRKRRPANVAIVALANKMARTIWALLVHGRRYAADHVSACSRTGASAASAA